ncbi:hypothetical protein [Pendulispora albinea]|uniref:Uncharacterized protein n=1 Tax=Pendulispora albinea TaxID=2741071 RepID=A0ABZ2LW63_9BACT
MRTILGLLLVATSFACSSSPSSPSPDAPSADAPEATVTSTNPLTAARPDKARLVAISASGGSLQNPCWSPNGDQLVFTRFRKGYNDGNSFVGRISTAGGTPFELTPFNVQSINLPGACWNATLNRIAFGSEASGHEEIFLVDPQGGHRTQVTRVGNRQASEPSISPDGQYIVFESHPIDREDDGQIWRVRTDSTELVQLTAGPNDKQPNWSPSGDRILFQRGLATGSGAENVNWEIYTMSPSGDSLRNVTRSQASDTDAAWSPDGAYIVYSSDEGGLAYANVFVIARDGGRPIRVTTSSGYDGAPSWSADGKSIAFESSERDPERTGTKIYVIDAPALR